MTPRLSLACLHFAVLLFGLSGLRASGPRAGVGCGFGIHLRGADAAQPPIGPDRAAACLGHGAVGRRGASPAPACRRATAASSGTRLGLAGDVGDCLHRPGAREFHCGTAAGAHGGGGRGGGVGAGLWHRRRLAVPGRTAVSVNAVRRRPHHRSECSEPASDQRVQAEYRSRPTRSVLLETVNHSMNTMAQDECIHPRII